MPGGWPNFRENARENATALPKPTIAATDFTLYTPPMYGHGKSNVLVYLNDWSR